MEVHLPSEMTRRVDQATKEDNTTASESEHFVLSEDDAPAIWFLGTLATIKAGGARTGDALAVVEFTHPPGFATPRHVHHTADEAFYVLEGTMRGFAVTRNGTRRKGHSFGCHGVSRTAMLSKATNRSAR